MSQHAAIFDLNGVFIQSPPLSRRFEADFGVPIDDFLAVLSQAMDVARKPGAPNVFSLFEPHLQRWGLPMDEEEFLEYWFSAEKEDEQMVAFARELKREGWKLFILSNNFKERTTYYDERFPFLREVFDHVYYSWQTGHVKPEPECFKRILEDNHLAPADCFYFDDSEKNVAAANALGLHAAKYAGLEQTRELLRHVESQQS